jgi:hypothetical protein
MRLVCWKVILGEDALRVFTTPAGNQGQYVKSIVPVGQPYWIWPSIPAGTVIACDFTAAPLSTASTASNNANIANINTLPEDVLTYEE